MKDKILFQQEEAFLKSAEYGYTESVQDFLDLGVDVNAQDPKNQETALINAAACGQIEIVEILLAHQADVNLQDKWGHTPLMMAALRGYSKIVEKLIAAGSEVDISDENGWTALIHSSERGYLESVKLLLDNGASMEARENWWKRTPLMVAAGSGQTKLVELLLDRGAQIDCQGKQRLTALLYAARENKEEIVHLLLDRGANPNSEDSRGNTALEYARQNKNYNLEAYIKKAQEKAVSLLLSQWPLKRLINPRYNKKLLKDLGRLGEFSRMFDAGCLDSYEKLKLIYKTIIQSPYFSKTYLSCIQKAFINKQKSLGEKINQSREHLSPQIHKINTSSQYLKSAVCKSKENENEG